MSNVGHFLREFFPLALVAVLVGWVIVRSVKKAEEPAWMIGKWLCTAVVVFILVRFVVPVVARGGYDAAFWGIPCTAVCGIGLTIIWRRSIAGLIARPFETLYSGGSEPPDPHPFYSVARARQKRGRYLEAVAEIQRQLQRFPTDVEGHILLAEVQAQDLHDLAAAEATVLGFCAQPGHAPQNIVFVLYAMADWHLQFARDRAAAQRNLEKVIELLPGSEFALGAAQRIARLNDPEAPLSPHESKTYLVPEGPRNLGLTREFRAVKTVENDPAQTATEYVKHLEQFPLDTEVREKLAVIYADHYQRLDMAAAELEQMITMPNQPGRLVVHWLNLLADLQVRCGGDFEAVRQTLQRIIDGYPNLAAAEIARKRLDLLKLEFKGAESRQTFKLGTYEQNIGLKHGPPQGLKLRG